MGCGGSKLKTIDESVEKVVDMLSNRPHNDHFIHKFRANANNLKNVEDAYKSGIFGGSIFLPLGSASKRGEKRDKTNNLQNEIKACHVDYLYGGGYYVLHNVKVNREEPTEENPADPGVHYMDIYMLVESVDKLDEMKKLKLLGQK